ncbi:hypothetical protein WOLCODRAFT_29287 [Wolfiporia cocos MD-104 SS10]|uniref:Uncharacterized protein n=1 Tax=Wolfiporia cocos (strain MD-104) TaxID=742152 RepID=A0A2H3J9P7_WOLCO|nr:hypothetical protein WOLCODRAFT_29287 [Wolfiporia cocos MD-104 SS10]
MTVLDHPALETHHPARAKSPGAYDTSSTTQSANIDTVIIICRAISSAAWTQDLADTVERLRVPLGTQQGHQSLRTGFPLAPDPRRWGSVSAPALRLCSRSRSLFISECGGSTRPNSTAFSRSRQLHQSRSAECTRLGCHPYRHLRDKW